MEKEQFYLGISPFYEICHISFTTYCVWRRKWQPTPVFLPEKFHRLKSLVGYSPWVRKDSNMTEWLNTHTHTHTHTHTYFTTSLSADFKRYFKNDFCCAFAVWFVGKRYHFLGRHVYLHYLKEVLTSQK